ncbi:MAG: hypothetical protein DRP35_01390 [Candidatus Zixiibacteriota bacterium]|nr:MAG: hypothetical protein DRP35_01390 [candidate division Zixibacteria bacterium]
MTTNKRFFFYFDENLHQITFYIKKVSANCAKVLQFYKKFDFVVNLLRSMQLCQLPVKFLV